MEPLATDNRKDERNELAMEEKEKGEKNIRSSVKEFTEDTSIHGVKNAFSGRGGRVDRIVWAILVLTAVGSLVMILFELFYSYTQRPVKTVVTVTPTDQLFFPAVTICNVNSVEMSKLRAQDTVTNNVSSALIALSLLTSLVKDRVNDTFEAVENTFPPELLNLTFEEVTRQAFTELNDTFITCFWDGQEESCEDMFQPVDLESRRCFQFNANTHVQRRVSRISGHTSGLEVLVNVRQEEYVFNKVLSAGAQVILHEPGEMPDIGDKGFLAAPGFSIMSRIKINKYHYLPAPFKAFGKDCCTNDVNLKADVSLMSQLPPNSHVTTYTHALCQDVCLQRLTQAKCDCRLASVSYAYDNYYSVCTIRDVYKCYFFSYVNFSKWSRQEKCPCQRRCESTEYTVSISSAYFPSDVARDILHQLNIMDKDVIRKNFIDLKIFYDDLMITDVSHVPEYTVASILGTVGGQMGLFIGASLLSLAEVLHLLLTVCRRAVHAVCCKLKGHISPKGKL